jgi:hypothetical protein
MSAQNLFFPHFHGLSRDQSRYQTTDRWGLVAVRQCSVAQQDGAFGPAFLA